MSCGRKGLDETPESVSSRRLISRPKDARSIFPKRVISSYYSLSFDLKNYFCLSLYRSLDNIKKVANRFDIRSATFASTYSFKRAFTFSCTFFSTFSTFSFFNFLLGFGWNHSNLPSRTKPLNSSPSIFNLN